MVFCVRRRAKAIQEVLARHVEDLGEERFDFLVSTLKLPETWIYAAQVRSSFRRLQLLTDLTLPRLSRRSTTATFSASTSSSSLPFARTRRTLSPS